MSNSLPEYERPPIDEVVFGVQFEPPPKLRAPHFGIYWRQIRARYPTTEDQPPLIPQIEPDVVTPQIPAVAFRTGPLVPRCWFVDSTGNELIQVQRDRFLRNWRRLKGDERYPRFAYLVEKFREEWNGFLGFLDAESIEQPKVNQCELSYINHLEAGAGWKGFSDLSNVFTSLQKPADGFLPEPELVSWESRYKLSEGKGRLHVEAQPVLRARDFKLIMTLTLTARGAPGESTAENLFSWFDLAHEWVVRGFDQLTQPAMHAFWGKK